MSEYVFTMQIRSDNLTVMSVQMKPMNFINCLILQSEDKRIQGENSASCLGQKAERLKLYFDQLLKLV